MSLILLIDDRERAVFEHLIGADFKYCIQRLTVGDYAICSADNKILAVLERKTHADFAASIKDNRHANKEKMIDLRAQTDCRVFYIVEGEYRPQSTKVIDGIPYCAIQSAIYHMMVRDQIFFLYTKDQNDTIAELSGLMKSMATLGKKMDLAEIAGGDASQILPEDSPPASQLGLLTASRQLPDIDVARGLWAKIPGITVENAEQYLKYSIAEIWQGNPAEMLADMKTPTGRKISKKIAETIATHDKKLEYRILSAVPKISESTAKEILAEITLAELLAKDEAAISNIKVGKAMKRLGPAKSAAIFKFLNFKKVTEEKNEKEN